MDKVTESILETAITSGSVEEKSVIDLQKYIGADLPTDYIDFLLNYGSAIVAGYDIYGLLASNDAKDSCICRSVYAEIENYRRDAGSTSSGSTLVPISDDGMGIILYIDTRFSPKTCISALGPGVRLDCMFNNFDEFIKFLAAGDFVFPYFTS